MNQLLIDYYHARGKHDELLQRLTARTNHIIEVMANYFKMKRKNYWWAYSYHYDADDAAPLPEPVKSGTFEVSINPDRGKGCVSPNNDYNSGFPVEFFDMSDEEIIAYLEKNN